MNIEVGCYQVYYCCYCCSVWVLCIIFLLILLSVCCLLLYFLFWQRQRHPHSNQIATIYGWPSVFVSVYGIRVAVVRKEWGIVCLSFMSRLHLQITLWSSSTSKEQPHSICALISLGMSLSPTMETMNTVSGESQFSTLLMATMIGLAIVYHFFILP